MDGANGALPEASAREAVRRERAPQHIGRGPPAMYMRDCSTAAQAAVVASPEPLASFPKPAREPRPTHFLALQVSHAPSVTDAIRKVQAAVCEHSPHLKKACVDAASSHLTLGVMALQGEQDIAHAEETLCQLSGVLSQEQLLEPLELKLGGLSHFRNQVLYLDVEEGEGQQRLHTLAAAVRSHFHAARLLQQADRPFVPHVTIAKLSKLPRGGKGGQRQWARKGKGTGGGGEHEGKFKGGEQGRREGRDRELRGMDEARADAGLEAEGALVVADREVEAQGLAAEAEQQQEATCREAANEEQLQPAAAADAGAAATLNGKAGGGERMAVAGSTGEAMGVAEDRDQQTEAGNDKRDRGKRGSKDESRAGIPQESYAALTGISAGGVEVAELQLCRMQGRRTGEYYQVLARLALLANKEKDVAVAEELKAEQAAGEREGL
ncbi:hypothetical protein N2152v2_007851 [Parachlorella kessleri]